MKKSTIFQSKIDEKSMKKWVAAPFSAKIEKIAVLGAQFPSKIDFLVDFGSPGGPKNRPNWVSHIDTTPSWSQLGTILGPRSHFSRFWLPFWVPLGLILDPSGLHFEKKCGRFRIFALVSHIVWLVGWLGWLVCLVCLVGWVG